MTEHIADHIAPSELVAAFQDKVPVALRLVDGALSCVNHRLDLSLIDGQSATSPSVWSSAPIWGITVARVAQSLE